MFRVCILFGLLKKTSSGHIVSLLFFLYSEKEVPSQSTHPSSVIHLQCDWIFVITTKETFKTSISLDISSVKNLFLCNVWKLWELLTLSQAMSLISTREWTTISFITIRKGKRKTISSIRKWSVCQALLNEELIEL